MKFVIFTLEGAALPVALKLKDEGNDVVVGQIEDVRHTMTDEEMQDAQKEDANKKQLRLSMYDGMLEKQDAVKLLKAMKKLKDKDYFIFTETNCAFQFTEIAQSLGFTGIMPTQEDRKMEVDRDAAKEVVRQHYPDLEVMDHQEFKTVEEGIQFLQETENIYVLKSLGDAGETIVPKVADPKLANQQIIDTLEADKESYEQNGFMLEQKIMESYELTPQLVFWDGKPVYASLDIETKTMGGHERGNNYGCGTNLIVKTDLDDKINQMAFPKYVYDLAKKHKGIFIVDAGILFDKKTNTPYFTEYCFQRFGWDCFPTELAMCDNVTSYFEKVQKGKNPLRKRFGAGVRLFNFNKNSDRYPQEEMAITWSEDAEECLYLYDAKKVDDKVVTAGFQEDLGVMTGAGDTLTEAITTCYEYADKVGFKDLYYKAHEDFVSMEYPQAILRRLQYAVERGLIKDSGIMSEIDIMSQKDPSSASDVRVLRGQLEDKAQEMVKVKEAIRKALKS